MFKKNTAGQFIHFQGVDAATGGIKSGVSWTVRRCIDGTFAAATGAVTEDGTTGWYKFAMSQADINGNNIGFNFTGTGAVPQTVNIITDGAAPDVNVTKVGGTAQTAGDIIGDTNDIQSRLPAALSAAGNLKADLKEIDEQATNGNNATLNLKKLNIVNNAGDAFVAQSTGGSGSGARLIGNGSGEGLVLNAGATGSALHAIASGGVGILIVSDVDDAIQANGGPSSYGINAYGGAAGILAEAGDDNGNGINAVSLFGGKSISAPQNIAVSDGDLTLAAISDTVWDEVLTGATHNVPSSSGRRLRQLQPNDTALRSGTAQAGGANTITLDAGASAVDDFYNNTFVVTTGGTGDGQARLIIGYVGSTKVATVDSNWSVNPNATTTFDIMPLGTVEVANIRDNVIDAGALATDAAQEIADTTLDRSDAIETGLTLRQALRIIAASTAGELSGAATTTITIRNAVADDKNRIIATVDSDGNRTNITYDTSN